MCLKITEDSVSGVASQVGVADQCRTLRNEGRCYL